MKKLRKLSMWLTLAGLAAILIYFAGIAMPIERHGYVKQLTIEEICKNRVGCDPLPENYNMAQAKAKTEAVKKNPPQKVVFGKDINSKEQEKECEAAVGHDCIYITDCARESFYPDCETGWQAFAHDPIDEYMIKAGCRIVDGCRPMAGSPEAEEQGLK